MKGRIALLTMALCTAAAWSADKSLAWPQFRGPGGAGIADGQKPPIEFGPTKNLKWKTPVPFGNSSPIVAGELLVITAFDNGKLYTIAYNRADGKEAWRKEAPAKAIEGYFKAGGSPAASTPTFDGERIFAYFGSCGVICYDLTGKELWKYETPTAVTIGNFGTGSSPIVADGLVVVVRDETKDPKIFALDAATGSIKWEKKRRSLASYSTPVVWETVGGKQIAVAGHGTMIGYDLKSGDEKWTLSGVPSGCVASPVVTDGTLVFAGYSPGGKDDTEFQMPKFDDILKGADTDKDGALSKAEADKTMLKDFFDSQDADKDGKITRDEWNMMLKFMAEGKSSALAVKPGGSGDITKTHVLWTKTKGLPYIASVITYRGQAVTVKDGGLITAYDVKTGKEIYTQERELAAGQYYASPVAANGHIYFVTMDDGTVTVVVAGSDKPKVAAKNPKLGEKVTASPAIADDTIYIRGDKHLYAFAEKR